MLLFACARLVANTDGSYPRWLMLAQRALFRVMWFMHDWALKPFIGDGEGSVEEVEGKGSCRSVMGQSL